MDDLIREKNRLLIELLSKQGASGSGRREVETLATQVAVLETRLAERLLSEGRVEDSVVSLISAASCLADARRWPEAVRLLARARGTTHLPTVQQWIAEDSKALAVSYANARLVAAAPEMLEALREIAKGEGRFSRDPLEHAANTIEDMKALAEAAITKAEGREETE